MTGTEDVTQDEVQSYLGGNPAASSNGGGNGDPSPDEIKSYLGGGAQSNEVTTPLTNQAVKETDRLGISGGPAQGPLGKLLGLRDPAIGSQGTVLPDVAAKDAAYQASIKGKGWSPMVGDVAESGARMATMGASIGMQFLPPDHPVRQQIEGTYSSINAIARSLSEEDNMALMVATAGLGGPAASAASKMGSRALSALFAAQIASSLPEQWRAFKAAPDLKTKTMMAAQLIGTIGFTGIAGKHAIMGERPLFGRISPPLEPEVTIPQSQSGQMEILNQGLARGDLTREQYDDLVKRVQGPAAPAAPGQPGVQTQTARVAAQPGAEAAPGEAAPVAEAPETPEEATERYNDVRDRFGIYGIPHEPIVDAAVAKGELLTPGEAADALEAHENTLPIGDRRLSIAQGKTFSELKMESQWKDYIGRKLREQDAKSEKQSGLSILSSQPTVQVDPLPEGGWKVTVGPREQTIQVPPQQSKGVATYQKRTVPQSELYLSPKGELIPYADKPNTPTNALPDVKGKPAVRGPEGQTETGGSRETSPQGPGAQPVTPGERPVATEAPQTETTPLISDAKYKHLVRKQKAGNDLTEVERQQVLDYEKTGRQRERGPATTPPEAKEKRYVVEDLFDPRTRKQTGYIVKDRETGDVVKKFQSPQNHPDASDLLLQREEAKKHIKELAEKTTEAAARSQEEEREPIVVGGAKKKRFSVNVVFDEYARGPETPVATAVSEMGGIKSKSAAVKQGKYAGNEALWDTPIKFSHLTHQKIYDENGEMPDVMAQNLYDAGLIHEPSVEAMRAALEKESAGIRTSAKNAPEKQTGVAGQVKQAENFGKGQRAENEGTGKAVAVDSLSIGDKVNVDGTELKVTDVDPDGNVTLEDGKRYGVQEVSGGDVIYGEMTPAERKTYVHQVSGKRYIESATNPDKLVEIKDGREVGPERDKTVHYTETKAAAAPERAAPGETAPTAAQYDIRDVGQHGQKALNTAPSNPVAARKAAFAREGDHHVHKDTGLIIRHNKEAGLFEVVHPETGEVLDTGPTRRATIDKHLDGLPRKAEAEPPPTTAEGEVEYDLGTMEGFQEAIKDRLGRDMTEAEKKAFEPFMRKVADARTDASEAGSMDFGKLLQTMHDVKDIPFDDAVKQIKDAISDATGPCT